MTERSVTPERVTVLENQIAAFADALTTQRLQVGELNNTLKQLNSGMEALRQQVEAGQLAYKQLLEKFENRTQQIADTNLAATTATTKAMQDALAQMVGNKVLMGLQYVVGTAIISGLGILLYKFFPALKGG